MLIKRIPQTQAEGEREIQNKNETENGNNKSAV
jgi:hypothetical protein